MMSRSVLARLLFVVPLLAVGIALGTPSPAAAAGECANQTLTGTIKTGLVVPAGTTCSLQLADVRGSVTVEAGGILFSTFSEIRGSVTATNPHTVLIQGGVVRGSVSVTGGTATVHVLEAEVRGNISFVSNHVSVSTEVSSAIVRGNVTVAGNTAPFNIVKNNNISGNLDCTSNSPVVTNSGLANTVGGAKTGECALL